MGGAFSGGKMTFSSVNLRMAYLDNYLDGLDSKIHGASKTSRPASQPGQTGFSNVFKTVSSNIIKSTQQAKATDKVQDDLSKLPKDFGAYIDTVAKEEGVDTDLLRSIIKQESKFNPSARSHRGAVGLMQLMPATAKELGVFNPANPYQNIKGGAKYISKMIKMFGGNIPKALAAYNAGPRNVQKYGGIPPFGETRSYVQHILKDYLKRSGYKPVDTIG